MQRAQAEQQATKEEAAGLQKELDKRIELLVEEK